MAPNLIGTTLLGQFRVDAFVASGGMGSVYRVWDLQRNVPLAMKVLHSELAEDPAVFKRFKREANALKRLTHPNIVQFYGLYETAEFPFIVQSFVDGISLQSVLRKKPGKSLGVGESLVYFKAVSAALGYAHANGVVHCDVKPGNVLIDRGGNIVITDFGVARHAESSATTVGPAGTPAYMAPEQILDREVSPATDVYALGVMLFELLTGQRPFRGAGGGTSENGATVAEAIRQAHLSAPRPDAASLNPSVPAALADALKKSMAIEPKERYASVQDFFAAVCLATGYEADRIPERVVDTTILAKRDYGAGKVIVSGESVTDKLSKRIPLIAGGAVLFVLVCVMAGIALLGNTTFTIAGATLTPTATRVRSTPTLQPTYTPRPTLTSAPANQTSAPPTSRVLPTYTVATNPVAYIRRQAYCRSGPGANFGDVTFVAEGMRYPIVGWNPAGWWKIEVYVDGKGYLRCWVGHSVVVIEGDISDVPVMSR